jgi:hypothetical protein
MVWEREVKLTQIYACPNFIDVSITEEDDKEWRFTGLCGEFKWAEKYKTWDRIRGIHQNNNLPWIILGDLDEFLYEHEKEGGRVRPQQYMQAFHNIIDTCGLTDIGFIGGSFTWHCGTMRERLDRGLVNASWFICNRTLLYYIWSIIILSIGSYFWTLNTI